MEKFLVLQSDLVCGANLTFVDVDDINDTITLGGTDVTIIETNITFITQQLRENRRYIVIVMHSLQYCWSSYI